MDEFLGKFNNLVQYSIKAVLVSFTAFMIVYFVRFVSVITNPKEDIEACKVEKQLQFEGVITEYNGSGMKTSPTVFMLSDSIYTVPRYNIEMQIALGDTIKKIKNEHIYYIKRKLYPNLPNDRFKRLDTIIFNCDIKE